MSRKKKTFFCPGDQRGMALVTALLLLMVVSLIAVGMSTDTSMDVRIAGYQKFKAVSFGYADAGVKIGTEVLEDNIYDAGWSDQLPLDFRYPYLDASYLTYTVPGDIRIYNDENFYMAENLNRLRNIGITGHIDSDVKVQRLFSKMAEGGAAQMAAGYEMLGKGAGGGGVHIIYNLEGEGTGASEARTEVGIHFRHVTD